MKNSLLRGASVLVVVAGSVSLFLLALVFSSPRSGGRGVAESPRSGASLQPAARGSLGVPGRPAGVPVLCYHYFRARTGPVRLAKIVGALLLNLPLLDDNEVWTQTAGSLARQMDYLAREGYRVVSLEELMAWRRGELELPAKSVAITIDDAHRSTYDIAYPILKEHGFRATLFVVTSKVGRDDWRGLEVLGWDRLAELAAGGLMSLGSHTHDLHYKVRSGGEMVPVLEALCSADMGGREPGCRRVLSDLVESRRLIAARTGREPAFLAWPYGFGSPSADRLALEAGFEGICTLAAGLNLRFPEAAEAVSAATLAGTGPASPVQDRLASRRIRRYTITARTSLSAFKKMLAGEIPPTR